MEPIESRSNQGLYYALLILMSIPVLYFIGTGVYKGSDFFRSYSIWTYINTAISIGFIALVAKRRFGILLFLIIPLIISTLYLLINALVYMRFYGYSDMMKTLFDLVKVASLILTFILLSKEKNRFFNLQFSSTAISLPQTYRLIKAFNITFLVVGGATILYILYEIDFQLIFLANEYALLYITTLVVTIIGVSNKSKLLNLGFAMALGELYLLFRENGQLLEVPFTESWSRGITGSLITYGIILGVILLIFGVFLIFIIRSYFKEKPLETRLPSNDNLLDILD